MKTEDLPKEAKEKRDEALKKVNDLSAVVTLHKHLLEIENKLQEPTSKSIVAGYRGEITRAVLTSKKEVNKAMPPVPTDRNGREFKVGQKVRHYGLNETATITEVYPQYIASGKRAWTSFADIEIIEIIEDPPQSARKLIEVDGKTYEVHSAEDIAQGVPFSFVLIEKPKPSGREVFSPETIKALDALDQILSRNDTESRRLADALAMLRGPDNGDEVDKLAATIPVRRALFPLTAAKKVVNFWACGTIADTKMSEVSGHQLSHYRDHANRAKKALNL